MELRNLKTMVEVARQGGFSQAAKVLFTTQPTVSKAVRQLEEELGEALFIRSSDGAKLTDAGEIVYARAVTILAQTEHLKAEVAELKGLLTGTLRLGLPLLGSAKLFAPLFATFRSQHPGVEIELLEQGSAQLEQAVLAGEVELAVSLLPVDEAFEWQSVCDDPLMVLLRPDNPLSNRKCIRLIELKDTPFILFKNGFVLNPRIEEACKRQGFTPHVSARSSQMDFIIALAAAGMGVPLLPHIMVEDRQFTPLRAVRIDEQDLHWSAALIWRRDTRLSPSARAWLALTRQQFPE